MRFRVAKIREVGRMDGGPDPRDEVQGHWRVTCLECRRVLGAWPSWDEAMAVVAKQFADDYSVDRYNCSDLHVFSACRWQQVRNRATADFAPQSWSWVETMRVDGYIDPGQPTDDNDPDAVLAGTDHPKTGKEPSRRGDLGSWFDELGSHLQGLASKGLV